MSWSKKKVSDETRRTKNIIKLISHSLWRMKNSRLLITLPGGDTQTHFSDDVDLFWAALTKSFRNLSKLLYSLIPIVQASLFAFVVVKAWWLGHRDCERFIFMVHVSCGLEKGWSLPIINTNRKCSWSYSSYRGVKTIKPNLATHPQRLTFQSFNGDGLKLWMLENQRKVNNNKNQCLWIAWLVFRANETPISIIIHMQIETTQTINLLFIFRTPYPKKTDLSHVVKNHLFTFI